MSTKKPSTANIPPGEKYVTAYESITGWKVAVMWHNPKGFIEPWDVLRQFGPYTGPDLACEDAERWGHDNNMPYIAPDLT